MSAARPAVTVGRPAVQPSVASGLHGRGNAMPAGCIYTRATTRRRTKMRIHTLLAGLLAGSAVLSVQAQQGPTDPQIAHIVVTANQVDIDAGKVAEKKGSTKD